MISSYLPTPTIYFYSGFRVNVGASLIMQCLQNWTCFQNNRDNAILFFNTIIPSWWEMYINTRVICFWLLLVFVCMYVSLCVLAVHVLGHMCCVMWHLCCTVLSPSSWPTAPPPASDIATVTLLTTCVYKCRRGDINTSSHNHVRCGPAQHLLWADVGVTSWQECVTSPQSRHYFRYTVSWQCGLGTRHHSAAAAGRGRCGGKLSVVIIGDTAAAESESAAAAEWRQRTSGPVTSTMISAKTATQIIKNDLVRSFKQWVAAKRVDNRNVTRDLMNDKEILFFSLDNCKLVEGQQNLHICITHFFSI